MRAVSELHYRGTTPLDAGAGTSISTNPIPDLPRGLSPFEELCPIPSHDCLVLPSEGKLSREFGTFSFNSPPHRSKVFLSFHKVRVPLSSFSSVFSPSLSSTGRREDLCPQGRLYSASNVTFAAFSKKLTPPDLLLFLLAFPFFSLGNFCSAF